jgi:hypothetical protein
MKCENCGGEHGKRRKCLSCSRMVCRFCSYVYTDSGPPAYVCETYRGACEDAAKTALRAEKTLTPKQIAALAAGRAKGKALREAAANGDRLSQKLSIFVSLTRVILLLRNSAIDTKAYIKWNIRTR